MNHQPLTDQIYTRHLAALRRVSGDGTWIDEPAVRMALWLSLTELEERLAPPPAPLHASWTNVAVNPPFAATTSGDGELQRLHAWLDDNIGPPHEKPVSIVDRAMDAIRHLQDAWAAEAAANAGLSKHNGDLERDQVAAVNEANMLRQQRDDQGERIDALETEISTLRAALAELQHAERIATHRVQELQAALDALQAAPVTLASPNGHGPLKAPPDFLASKADPPEGLSPAGEDAWRSCQQGASFRRLPVAIRLELAQAVLRQAELGQPMKMIEYDALKPSWMPRFRARFSTYAEAEAYVQERERQHRRQ